MFFFVFLTNCMSRFTIASLGKVHVKRLANLSNQTCCMYICIWLMIIFEFLQMKCVKYWPDKGENMAFGDVNISTMSEDHWPDFTIRQLKVTKVCSKCLWIMTLLFSAIKHYRSCDWLRESQDRHGNLEDLSLICEVIKDSFMCRKPHFLQPYFAVSQRPIENFRYIWSWLIWPSLGWILQLSVFYPILRPFYHFS